MMGADTATTLNKRDNSLFASTARSGMLTLTAMFVLFESADERFIDLDGFSFPAKHFRVRFAQRFANAMAKKPSGFLAQSEQAADLKGAHALLAGHHEVGCGKPLVQRNLAALIQRANRDRERLAAGIALIEAVAMTLALHECGVIHSAAMRADRAIRPELPFKPLASLGFVIKDRLRQVTHGLFPPT